MQKCRICGCTHNTPCEGGCYWIEDNLCSKCVNKLANQTEIEAPKECPITGMPFSGLVYEYDGIWTPVYSFNPYKSFTIPWYCEDEKAFYRKVYDEDEGCWTEESQHFLDLEELKKEGTEEKYMEIKMIYNIVE